MIFDKIKKAFREDKVPYVVASALRGPDFDVEDIKKITIGRIRYLASKRYKNKLEKFHGIVVTDDNVSSDMLNYIKANLGYNFGIGKYGEMMKDNYKAFILYGGISHFLLHYKYAVGVLGCYEEGTRVLSFIRDTIIPMIDLLDADKNLAESILDDHIKGLISMEKIDKV